MAKTITAEITIPDDSEWMTTDEYGRLDFWRTEPRVEEFEWGAKWRGTGYLIGSINTGIPCPNWRDSLTKL